MNFLTTARPARLRLIFAATAIALAGLLAPAFRPGSPASAAYTGRLSWTGNTKPVIVLEHGAWADSSSWDQVIRILTHEGFTVYAPPDPLRGLASDSAYLHDFLTENAALAGKTVVLVGHSYGGAVITDAAVGDREVKALVYVDAFIPAEGESIGALLARPRRRLVHRRQPGRRLRPGTVPRRSGRRHRPLPSAGQVLRLLRQRPQRQPGRPAGRHPAAAGVCCRHRGLRHAGLEDHPVLGRGRHC